MGGGIVKFVIYKKGDIMEEGIVLTGIFISSETKVRRYDNYDNGDKVSYIYLVVIGSDAFKVSSDYDYRSTISFGDRVSFKVRCRAFNNSVYYNGELIS